MSLLIGVGWAVVPLERITPTARIVTLLSGSIIRNGRVAPAGTAMYGNTAVTSSIFSAIGMR